MTGCRIAMSWCLLAGGLMVCPASVAESPTEEDPLAVNMCWKGKFTQGGTHPELEFPPELIAELTVVARDGDHVDLELRESLPGMDVTFLCRGRVHRSPSGRWLLEFRSYALKGQNAGFYLIDVPYQAEIAGQAIKGSWAYVVREEGIDLGGEFRLIQQACQR